jgi:hypothetical protein
MPLSSDLLHEFLENSQQIRDLLDRNFDIIREVDRAEYERAKAYWYAHIICALTNDHDYLGSSMSTMQDAAEVIENKVYGKDQDGE